MPKNSTRELQLARRAPAETIRQLADKVSAEKRDFTTEERKAWDRANDEFNRLTMEIEMARDGLDDFDGPAGIPRFTRDDANSHVPAEVPQGRDERAVRRDAEDECLSLQAWCLSMHSRTFSERHARACKRTGINPYWNEISLTLRNDQRHFGIQKRTTNGGLSAVTGNL
ncbi:MAG TPA: hypothetical protein VN641_00850, partial [Urbifossiella sp.]|nr:hypothetical protein [Urbifossiella sp.]